MNVLDPFEVAAIEMWPLWALITASSEERRETLDNAEFTVFQQLLQESEFNAVLNEVMPTGTTLIDLPTSLRVSIVPPELLDERKHPDVRLALFSQHDRGARPRYQRTSCVERTSAHLADTSPTTGMAR